MPKYVDRSKLDHDLLVLKRAMENKITSWSESEDWQLPLIIEQYRQSNVNALLHPGLIPVENTGVVIHETSSSIHTGS